MNLLDLRNMTRTMARDSNGYMFLAYMVDDYINQGIDRLRQTVLFRNMEHLEADEDVPDLLPSQYHYLLAIFAASRCLEFDERHYEAIDRRNEFENLLAELLSEVESGNLVIHDNSRDDGKQEALNNGTYIDYIKDEYFDCLPRDSEVIFDAPVY